MTAMRTIFLPDRQYTYYLGATLNRAGILRYRKNYGDWGISSGLFLLRRLQHLLSGGQVQPAHRVSGRDDDLLCRPVGASGSADPRLSRRVAADIIFGVGFHCKRIVAIFMG